MVRKLYSQNKMEKNKELAKEKDFIMLRASNYHYDLGVEHTKEEIIKLINEMKLHNSSDENRSYNLALKELKQKIKWKKNN